MDQSIKPKEERTKPNNNMKLHLFFTAVLLCASIFLQSCAGSLSDDAFAHAVKRGDRNQTMSLMQPHHGTLQVQEVNGKWYNPLQYAIASGDKDASFALIDRGAPTSFDGRSLAYNAARVNHGDLARSFANAGYGSSSDINRAYADARAEKEANSRASAAALAVGVVFLAALMSGSGGGGGSAKCACGADAVNGNMCVRCSAFAISR